MTELVVDLFDRIDKLPDGADENQLAQIVSAWRGEAEGAAIRQALSEWLGTSADIELLKLMARETSTHYVWPLHLNGRGYGVVINEFKNPQDITMGYATTLHNHRYSFVSLVLSGGYRQTRSNVEFLNSHLAAQISDLSQDEVTEGGIVTVNHSEFHRLGAIGSCTLTLVAKCPAARNESLSVDTGTLRVAVHVPVERRIGQLMQVLMRADEQWR